MRTAEQSPPFDVVAVASSAGGVAALSEVLAELPRSFPTPIVVVQHLDPNHRSMLAEIMDRRSRMHAVQAQEGTRIEPGTVYLAPPGKHLLVGLDGRLSLAASERVHFARPSADVLFESVARAYGERAVGVVLTGSGSDGADGVRAIKAAGGTVVVQDPESAQFPSMPEAAIATGCADLVVPLSGIAPRLIGLLDPHPADG